MIVRIHGFDWHIYSQQVMPALGRWLLKRDEKPVSQMYQQTRCALEEQCAPAPLQSLCTWPRAQIYVQQLSRSPYALREYELLCSPERFTAISDRYVYRYPPQLLPPSEAVRTVWGSLIETCCLPWLSLLIKGTTSQEPAPSTSDQPEQELLHLHRAAMSIASEAMEQKRDSPELEMPHNDAFDSIEPTGVVIGRLPTTLHIRGWLAPLSVRAMALFELLACERRCMPFGYQPGTPFSSYAGYLTPREVHQLATSLHGIQPPNQSIAVIDHQRYHQQATNPNTPRMIDELLPLHADTFLSTVRLAAQQGLGLICTIG